jgi:serine O-acetyltransferase
LGRIVTAIEIHPGAKIGRRFVIDHGTGVVIGETSIVGDDVTLYHSVTLGGTAPSIDSGSQIGKKRHPTVEDGAIIGSGAAVLGPITIGRNARVGANSVVTKDVPDSVTAVGIPARVVMPRDKSKAQDFQPYGTPSDGGPDPLVQTIEGLRGQIFNLMRRVDELEAQQIETSQMSPPKRGDKAS